MVRQKTQKLKLFFFIALECLAIFVLISAISVHAATHQYLAPVLSFEGRIPIVVAPFGLGDFSMAFGWYKLTRDQNFLALAVYKGDSVINYYNMSLVILGYDQGQNNVYVTIKRQDTQASLTLSVPFTPSGNSRFLVLSCDRDSTTGLKLWLDGKVIAMGDPTPFSDVDFSPSAETGLINFNYGANPSGYGVTGLYLDNPMIFTGKALSPTEIQQLYTMVKADSIDEDAFKSIANSGFYADFNGDNSGTYNTNVEQIPAYTTGTISFTEWQSDIYGVGTYWTQNMVGRNIHMNNVAGAESFPEGTDAQILSVISPTHLTVAYVQATEVGITYSIGNDESYGFGVQLRRLISGTWSNGTFRFASYEGKVFSDGRLLFSDLPAPVVVTQSVTNIATSTATGNGNITNNPSTVRGVEWGTSSGVYANSSTESGIFDTGTFTQSITNLNPNTTYFYVAEAYNENGWWGYGSEQSFTTLAPNPTNLAITTTATTSVLTVDSFTNATASSSGYKFTNTTKGTTSDWIQTNSWQETGLACGTNYTYTVKYRNGDAVETTTATTTATTSACVSSHASHPQFSPQTFAIQPITPSFVAPSPSSLITFSTNYSVGHSGNDIKLLQILLNTHGFLLASFGPGSPNYETNYFGPLTKSALIRFQETYSKEILAPLGLTKGTGFFGPLTRNYINSLK